MILGLIPLKKAQVINSSIFLFITEIRMRNVVSENKTSEADPILCGSYLLFILAEIKLPTILPILRRKKNKPILTTDAPKELPKIGKNPLVKNDGTFEIITCKTNGFISSIKTPVS